VELHLCGRDQCVRLLLQQRPLLDIPIAAGLQNLLDSLQDLDCAFDGDLGPDFGEKEWDYALLDFESRGGEGVLVVSEKFGEEFGEGGVVGEGGEAGKGVRVEGEVLEKVVELLAEESVEGVGHIVEAVLVQWLLPHHVLQ
jgi:hypothetical protein